MTDLGTLGGVSTAEDINERGQVVGRSTLAKRGEFHAFLWEDGTMTDLGTLSGLSSQAYGINDRGQVVGFSQPAVGQQIRATLWTVRRGSAR